MEDKKKEMNWEEIGVSKIIGIILLIPPVISVIAFLINFITGKDLLTNMDSWRWFGNWGGTDFAQTSPLPFYFGLMAIAGAYLIKDHKK